MTKRTRHRPRNSRYRYTYTQRQRALLRHTANTAAIVCDYYQSQALPHLHCLTKCLIWSPVGAYRKLVDDVFGSGESYDHADGDHAAVVVVVRVRRVR